METKPSIYTSEFWLTLFTVLGSLVNWTGIWDFMSNWHSGIMSAIVLGLYQFSRGLAKSKAPYTPPASGAKGFWTGH